MILNDAACHVSRQKPWHGQSFLQVFYHLPDYTENKNLLKNIPLQFYLLGSPYNASAKEEII